LPNKELLEKYPLYRKVEMVLPVQRHRWPRPAIVANCRVCASSQTFTMISDYTQYDETKPKPGPSGVFPPYPAGVKVVYQCAGCGQMRRYFLLYVVQPRPRSAGGMIPPADETKAVIQKVGQFPPWDIAPDPQLAKKLRNRVGLFKNGLICESQSFGLGAFAYYRRIVELLIDELLNDIQELVSEDARDDYSEALQKVKASRRASDKIEHVKELLPQGLRPGGANPLALLHGALSDGLHNLTEEECIERAPVIRGAIVYLVSQVRQDKESATQFKKNLQDIVDRRSQRDKDESQEKSDR